MMKKLLSLSLFLCMPIIVHAQQQPVGCVRSIGISRHDAQNDTVKLVFSGTAFDQPVSLLLNPRLAMDIQHWFQGKLIRTVREYPLSSILTDLIPNPIPNHLYETEWTLSVPWKQIISSYSPPRPSIIKYRYVGMGSATSFYRGNVKATSTATPYPGPWVVVQK